MKYRFTLPRDIYFGEESLAELKNLRGKRAMVVTGGHAMQKFGWLEKPASKSELSKVSRMIRLSRPFSKAAQQ